MGLRIGAGAGLGPIGVGGSFRVGGGRSRGNGGGNGGWLVFVVIALGVLAAIVFGFLIICFSIGFLIAHLAGSGGLKSANRRPWISRFLLSFGVLVVIYLVNRGGLGSAWSNFDFLSEVTYESGRRYEGSYSDDWQLLYELGLWSFALGLLLSTPAHWMICKKHHPNSSRQQRSASEYIKNYWSVYSSVLALPGLGLLIWMFVDEDRMLETPGGLLAFIVIYGVISGVFLVWRVGSLLLGKTADKMTDLKHSFSESPYTEEALPHSKDP